MGTIRFECPACGTSTTARQSGRDFLVTNCCKLVLTDVHISRILGGKGGSDAASRFDQVRRVREG